MKILINKEVNEYTLQELKELCRKDFHESPALFLLLSYFSDLVLADFDGQAMPEERYKNILTIIPEIEMAFNGKDIKTLNELSEKMLSIFPSILQ